MVWVFSRSTLGPIKAIGVRVSFGECSKVLLTGILAELHTKCETEPHLERRRIPQHVDQKPIRAVSRLFGLGMGTLLPTKAPQPKTPHWLILFRALTTSNRIRKDSGAMWAQFS